MNNNPYICKHNPYQYTHDPTKLLTHTHIQH